MGPGQTNPRFQSGLRFSPTKDIDFDVIYGRNLLGEWANWITVGLTVRIGDNWTSHPKWSRPAPTYAARSGEHHNRPSSR
jgi:hypothetical protein